MEFTDRMIAAWPGICARNELARCPFVEAVKLRSSCPDEDHGASPIGAAGRMRRDSQWFNGRHRPRTEPAAVSGEIPWR